MKVKDINQVLDRQDQEMRVRRRWDLDHRGRVVGLSVAVDVKREDLVGLFLSDLWQQIEETTPST